MDDLIVDPIDDRLIASTIVDEDFDAFEPVEIREYMNSYEANDHAFQ